MKRICLIFGAIIFLLTSCSLGGLNNMWNRFNDTDSTKADTRMNEVLEAIKNKDKEALKSMFSKKAIATAENFDQSINDIFDFYQGNFVSYNNWGGPGADGGINADGTGRRWKSLQSTYDVETSEQKYRFAIKEFIQDTADSDNIGVWSLYIIKMEDTNEKFAYWGDQKWTQGININKKQALPD